MRFLPNVTFEPLAGFTEKFWCHGQIALGSSDVHVPEISRQLGQQALHISSLAIPANQPMNCEGVSQVMKSGLKTSSIMPLHSCSQAQAAEDSVCGPSGYPVSRARNEEWGR
jgi:hypothetical protein